VQYVLAATLVVVLLAGASAQGDDYQEDYGLEETQEDFDGYEDFVDEYEEYDEGKFGYYDEYYDDYNYGNWYDEDYGAEGDEYGYEEEYGYGDEYGYDEYGYEDYPQDYYMDYDYFDEAEDCVVDEAGNVQLLGMETCDLKITGGDSVMSKESGGIDGTYEVAGCHDGKPMYKRSKGDRQDKERLLWYSALYKDWDFNEGSVVIESDILGYGGDGLGEERPVFVPLDKWNVLAEHATGYGEEMRDFVPVNLQVTCANGKELEPPRAEASQGSFSALGQHPLLTDEEWEAKYQQVFRKYTKKSGPKVNTTMVALVVLAGIAIVLGIPYMVYFKKGPKSKAYALLHSSRKQMSGHKL